MKYVFPWLQHVIGECNNKKAFLTLISSHLKDIIVNHTSRLAKWQWPICQHDQMADTGSFYQTRALPLVAKAIRWKEK